MIDPSDGPPGGTQMVAPAGGPLIRPRRREVLHQYAFFASLLAGPLLVLSAATARATVAAEVYAVSICGLFGVSALYHRITWTPQVRRRLRHSTTR